MSWFDALSQGFSRLLSTKGNRIAGKIEALNPFVQNNDLIDSVVAQRLSLAESRIYLAISTKLRDRGVSDVQNRVRDRMQEQVDAYVDAVLSGTPGIDLPQFNIGANPAVMARIQQRLASFETDVLDAIARRFTPQKGFVESSINQGVSDIDSMIDAAIYKKLNSQNADTDVRRAIEKQVDALLDPMVDRIVAAVEAMPEINLPI